MRNLWVHNFPHCSFCHTERIPGVIKGSEKALSSATGYLDFQTYCSLSDRLASVFAGQREEVYQLFEVYLRLKKENRDMDPADRYGLKPLHWHLLRLTISV